MGRKSILRLSAYLSHKHWGENSWSSRSLYQLWTLQLQEWPRKAPHPSRVIRSGEILPTMFLQVSSSTEFGTETRFRKKSIFLRGASRRVGCGWQVHFIELCQCCTWRLQVEVDLAGLCPSNLDASNSSSMFKPPSQSSEAKLGSKHLSWTWTTGPKLTVFQRQNCRTMPNQTKNIQNKFQATNPNNSLSHSTKSRLTSASEISIIIREPHSAFSSERQGALACFRQGWCANNVEPPPEGTTKVKQPDGAERRLLWMRRIKKNCLRYESMK